jgi:hypothetical protein
LNVDSEISPTPEVELIDPFREARTFQVLIEDVDLEGILDVMSDAFVLFVDPRMRIPPFDPVAGPPALVKLIQVSKSPLLLAPGMLNPCFMIAIEQGLHLQISSVDISLMWSLDDATPVPRIIGVVNTHEDFRLISRMNGTIVVVECKVIDRSIMKSSLFKPMTQV